MHIYWKILKEDNRRKLIFVLALITIVTGVSVMACPVFHAVRRTYVATTSKLTWLNIQHASNQTFRDGRPAAWLQIEKAGIDSLVLLGADEQNLSQFPSCHSSYSIPGSGGFSVILGHRDTHFNGLEKLNCGDEVKVQSVIGEWKSYLVTKCEVVKPSAVAGMVQDKQWSNGIVLMTCYPFSYIGPAPKRYMVWAEPL